MSSPVIVLLFLYSWSQRVPEINRNTPMDRHRPDSTNRAGVEERPSPFCLPLPSAGFFAGRFFVFLILLFFYETWFIVQEPLHRPQQDTWHESYRLPVCPVPHPGG